MMAVKEDLSDGGMTAVYCRSGRYIFTDEKTGWKISHPRSCENLESTPRLRGSTWEVVADGAIPYSAVWLIDYS